MRKKHIHLRGLTLIEMLLYVGICSLFLISLSTFSASVLGVKVKARTINEVNQQGLQIIQLLSYTIRNASAVRTPNVSTSSSTLILSMRYPTVGTTTFTVSNGALFMQEGTSTPITLSNSRVIVQNLLFTNTSASSTDGGSVTLGFTLQYYNPANKNEFSFQNSFNTIVPFH